MTALKLVLPLALLLAGCGAASSAPAAPRSTSPAKPAASAPAAAPASNPAASAVAPASKPAASASAAAKPAASGLTKLNVGFGQLIPQYWPLWVAQDGGIYASNGLDVSQQNIAASTILAALLSGQVDIVVTGGSELLHGIANGADLVTVANLAPVITEKLEVSPSIKTKDDLIGKKLGITRFGSTTDTNSRDLLERIGLNPNKDVAFVQLNTAAGLLAGLLAGSIDGMLMSPPQTATAERSGFHPLYNLADFKLPATGQIVVMKRAYLTSHHAEAQHFVDSLLDGLTRIRQDKPAAIASLKKWMKVDNQDDLNATYDYFVKSVFPPVPYAQPDQFNEDVAQVRQQTGKLQDFDMSKVIDSSLIKDAVDRGLAKP